MPVTSYEQESGHIRATHGDDVGNAFEAIVTFGEQILVAMNVDEAAKKQALAAHEAWKRGDTVHSLFQCDEIKADQGWHKAGDECYEHLEHDGFHTHGDECLDYAEEAGYHTQYGCIDYLGIYEGDIEDARRALDEIHKKHDEYPPEFCPECKPISDMLRILRRTQ